MPLKYPLVDECVIVIADLFLPEDSTPDAAVLPGLERVARFGGSARLQAGWRSWLAGRVGCKALAGLPAACVAAIAADTRIEGFVSLATPVHWLTGLSSLHWDSRGILRLPAATLQSLARDFKSVFHGSGFALEPLLSGGFLMTGPVAADAQTMEPARCIGASIATALPAAPDLRRLGAEIEIWLHEQPANVARSARGELPLSSLWLWGGGRVASAADLASACSDVTGQRFYGSDPYLDGLARACGAGADPLPERIEAALSVSARRVVVVVDLAQILQADRFLSVPGALAALDARWIAPAAAEVARGAVRSLSVLANDRCLSFLRRDRFKRWRHARRGLAGLQ
jgi:hypothetical protein